MSAYIPPTLVVKGLNSSDVAAVRSILASREQTDDARLEESELPPNKFGEPITVALMVSATAAGIGVLGAFLMKKRRNAHVRIETEIWHPDGRKEKQILEGTWSESESPPADVVGKLATLSKLTADQVEKLLP